MPPNNQPQGGEQHHAPPNAKAPETQPEPRIYVASLSDYNNGYLHGEWVNAARQPEDVQTDITNMLSQSETPGAEEWAIHDHEGFHNIHLNEHEPIDRVTLIARNLAELGPAYAHWVNHIGTDDHTLLETFEDHYLGEWSSTANYAQHILDELGATEAIKTCIPGHLRLYVTIDSTGYARDLELSGDIWTHPTETGTVHIYDARP